MVTPPTHFQCQMEWSKVACLPQCCSVSSSLRCFLQLSPKLRQESKIHCRTDGDFFNLRRLKSYTKVTQAIVRDFLFADDCTLAAHSRGRSARAGWLFRHCSKDIRANSEHQENWGVETARPKHCSAPTQHHHGRECAEKCGHFQIPRQLHKLCSQHWWRGSVPHLTSKPGIWTPPHPSIGMSGAFRSRPSWRCTKLLCYRLSCTAARLGLATGGAHHKTGQVPPALPSQSSPCQLEGPHVPNQEILRRFWAHWHWSHVEPGTALLVRTCPSHGRQQTPKNNCSMLSSQLENGTKAGRGSGTKMCLKSTLKAYNIPVNEWQALAQDRLAWRAAICKGTKHFERSLLQSLDDKKIGQEEQSAKPLHCCTLSALRQDLHFHFRAPSSYAQTPALDASSSKIEGLLLNYYINCDISKKTLWMYVLLVRHTS